MIIIIRGFEQYRGTRTDRPSVMMINSVPPPPGSCNNSESLYIRYCQHESNLPQLYINHPQF